MSVNRRAAWLLGLLSLSSWSLGCMASEGQLRQKAASDFQCAPDTLSVKEARKDVYEVSGCDQKNTYVYSAEAQAWLRESDAGGKVIQ